MKTTIFLYADKWGVNRMTKSLGQVRRGEIPVKLELDIHETAFREPVITKQVEIVDWRDGVDIADVEFKEPFITEDEAKKIRGDRLEAMVNVLQLQGFQVSRPDAGEVAA